MRLHPIFSLANTLSRASLIAAAIASLFATVAFGESPVSAPPTHNAAQLTSGTAANARLTNAGVTPINGVSCTLGSACTVGSYVLCSSGASVAAGADTTEDIAATCVVPASALTANGCINVSGMLDYTNSSNNKTIKVRVNTNGTATGTVYVNTVMTTTSNFPFQTRICGANSTTAQIGGPTTGINTTNVGALATSSLTTTNAWDIVITLQKASSGETFTLDQYQVVAQPF